MILRVESEKDWHRDCASFSTPHNCRCGVANYCAAWWCARQCVHICAAHNGMFFETVGLIHIFFLSTHSSVFLDRLLLQVSSFADAQNAAIAGGGRARYGIASTARCAGRDGRESQCVIVHSYPTTPASLAVHGYRSPGWLMDDHRPGEHPRDDKEMRRKAAQKYGACWGEYRQLSPIVTLQVCYPTTTARTV